MEEYIKKQWLNDKRTKVDELKNMITQSAKDCKSSVGNFLKFLQVKGKTLNYKTKNNYLIYAQNQDVNYVKSYDFWKKNGYSIKKGEKAIKILVSNSKDSPFNVENRFDISQTNCLKEDYNRFIKSCSENEEKSISSLIFDEYFQKSNTFEDIMKGMVLKSYFSLKLSENEIKIFENNFEATDKKDLNQLLKNIEKSIDEDIKMLENKSGYIDKSQLKNKSTVMRIKEEIPIAYVAEREGFHLVKSGKYYHLKEHDSVVIFNDTNSYYRFSDKTGGSNIDFLKNMKGMSLNQAIDSLKAELSENLSFASENKSLKKTDKFTLPKSAQNNNRLFAYLTNSRGLDRDVVKNFINNKSQHKSYIYQDINNNVVFVGCDKNGEEKFATVRTTLSFSNFRHDVKNSDKSIAWSIDNNADTLFVCEAPIDLMSLMNLQKDDNEPKTANYLAMCGVTNDKSIYKFLDEHKGITKVTLALDDDEPGRACDKKIAKKLLEKYPNVEISFRKPMFGKDLNDELVSRKKGEKAFFRKAEKIVKSEIEKPKNIEITA